MNQIEDIQYYTLILSISKVFYRYCKKAYNFNLTPKAKSQIVLVIIDFENLSEMWFIYY